jgi:hypothetical protein
MDTFERTLHRERIVLVAGGRRAIAGARHLRQLRVGFGTRRRPARP